MVDEKQIAFRPAVEISYLAEEQQYTLLEAMSYNDATPSLAQAIKMKKFNQDGKLTDEVIQSIMEEEKPNQKEKPVFRDERITKLIPKTVPKGQEADFVVKALEFLQPTPATEQSARKIAAHRGQGLPVCVNSRIFALPLSTPHPLTTAKTIREKNSCNISKSVCTFESFRCFHIMKP